MGKPFHTADFQIPALMSVVLLVKLNSRACTKLQRNLGLGVSYVFSFFFFKSLAAKTHKVRDSQSIVLGADTNNKCPFLLGKGVLES